MAKLPGNACEEEENEKGAENRGSGFPDPLFSMRRIINRYRTSSAED